MAHVFPCVRRGGAEHFPAYVDQFFFQPPAHDFGHITSAVTPGFFHGYVFVFQLSRQRSQFLLINALKGLTVVFQPIAVFFADFRVGPPENIAVDDFVSGLAVKVAVKIANGKAVAEIVIAYE